MRSLLQGAVRVAATVLGWLGFLSIILFLAALAPLTSLLMRVWPGAREVYVAITYGLFWVYIRAIPFARIRLEGAEQLTGARVLVANHQSRLDSPVLLAFEPRLCGPVRGYMLRVPLIAQVIRLLGFFDADAGEWASVEAMHAAAEDARARGGALLFYPEGTRSKDGEVVPFRRGAFRTAVDHDLPIQPIVIEGLDTVLPPGQFLSPSPLRYPVRVRYLEPIRPPFGSEPRRGVVRALADRVHDEIVAELARMRAERHPVRDREGTDRTPAQA